MKRFKLYAASLALLLGLGTFGLQTVPAFAQFTETKNAACEGVSASGQACDNGAGVGKLASVAVNILSTIVGIAAVIMIIIAGLRYITSGGDASSVSSAKRTLMYAVIGLVVVFLAQFIVHFVIERVLKP